MLTISEIRSKNDFIQYLQSSQERYTAAHRRLATYLIHHFIEVAFMKAQQWAQKAETSEVSVIRFVRVLGFKGYPEFSEKMQQVIRKEMTMTDYAEMTTKMQPHGMDIFLEAVQAERKNLQEMSEKYSPKVMAAIISKINRAERVIVLGLRSSAPLAEYCSYMIARSLGKEVLLIKDHGSHTFDRLLSWEGKPAVVIAFAYPRYPSQTLKIAEHLKSKGWPLIGITNDELSPLVPISDHVLYAPSHSLAFTDSLGAPALLINTLIVEMIHKYPQSTMETITRFEKLAKEHRYFWPD